MTTMFTAGEITIQFSVEKSLEEFQGDFNWDLVYGGALKLVNIDGQEVELKIDDIQYGEMQEIED